MNLNEEKSLSIFPLFQWGSGNFGVQFNIICRGNHGSLRVELTKGCRHTRVDDWGIIKATRASFHVRQKSLFHGVFSAKSLRQSAGTSAGIQTRKSERRCFALDNCSQRRGYTLRHGRNRLILKTTDLFFPFQFLVHVSTGGIICRQMLWIVRARLHLLIIFILLEGSFYF